MECLAHPHVTTRPILEGLPWPKGWVDETVLEAQSALALGFKVLVSIGDNASTLSAHVDPNWIAW